MLDPASDDIQSASRGIAVAIAAHLTDDPLLIAILQRNVEAFRLYHPVYEQVALGDENVIAIHSMMQVGPFLE